MLLLNILEAIIQDATGRHLAHWLVVASGILVMFTLPSFHRCIQIDFSSPTRDVAFLGMDRKWIVEYTLWNWAFVFLNFPVIAGHQLAALVAAAIIGFSNPTLWLQARAYTLASDLFLMATFPSEIAAWSDSEHWANSSRELVVSVSCLLVIIGCSVRCFRSVREKKDGVLPKEDGRRGELRKEMEDE